MESDDFAVLRTQSKQFLNNNKKKKFWKKIYIRILGHILATKLIAV